MKLIDLIYEYLECVKYSLKQISLIDYRQNINCYIRYEIGQEEIECLDNEKLNVFILSKYRGYSASGTLAYNTLNTTKSIINKSLKYGYEKGYNPQNIRITVNFKKDSISKVESLTNKEALSVENYILSKKKFYSYGVILSMYTGLRIGELLALKWQDVDLKNKIMSVTATACDIALENKMYHLEDTPKSESSLREVPLTNEIIELLYEMKKYQNNNSKYVIARPSGKRIFIRAYQESFERLLKRLKIRHYGFHSLRHTFATRCYKLGMDIKTLSELLGHSSPAITLKIYVHTDLDTKRNALNQITKKIRQKSA